MPPPQVYKMFLMTFRRQAPPNPSGLDRAPSRLLTLVALTATAMLLATPPASAHPAPFSDVDLRLADGLTGRLVVHDLDLAHDLGLAAPEPLMDAAELQRLRPTIVRLLGECHRCYD